MTDNPFVLTLAGVFAGITGLMLALAILAQSPVPLFIAVFVGLTAGIMWSHGSGRLEALMFRRTHHRTVHDSRSSGIQDARVRSDYRDRIERDARQSLGVGPAADRHSIRRAYRAKAKRVHPDAPHGSEDQFKRLTRAYERLIDRDS